MTALGQLLIPKTINQILLNLFCLPIRLSVVLCVYVSMNGSSSFSQTSIEVAKSNGRYHFSWEYETFQTTHFRPGVGWERLFT